MSFSHRRCSSRSGQVSFAIVLVLIVVAIGIGAGATYVIAIRNPIRATEQEARDRLLHMTGMDKPVVNKLADGFVDADGDRVADCPADAAKQVDPKTIVFSYVAVEDAAEYEKMWKPFCDHLAKVTGKSVEYLAVKSSEEQLQALHDGKLHVTGFNSGSVPFAVNACGFVPVARIPTSDAAGTHVEIIVPTGSPIQDVNDLRDGKYTIAFTEPNSNTGYKAPMVLLHRDYQLDPERDYHFRTSGGHSQSIEGIASKQYEAAAVAADVLAREEANGTIKKSDYRSIFKSTPFPSAAIGYAYNLKPELAAKVREAISTFDMKDSDLASAFKPAAESKFIPVTYASDWTLIRMIDDACGQSHSLK